MMLAGAGIPDEFTGMTSDIAKGKFGGMAKVHHLLSGFKALFTGLCKEGVELARMHCGGAAYSAFAGFAQIGYLVSSSVTYEGDNTVMFG